MKTSLLSWSMVLVATALVACGDDSASTTGAGGEGGTDPSTTSTGTPTSSSSGNNTTTTSTGNPTSTASTSSGEQGGGGNGQGGDTTSQGGGGNGQGGDTTSQGGGGSGAGDCTAITLDDLVNNSQQGVGFIAGTPNPTLGDALEDVGQIELYEDGKNFDAGTPGEFDLSEEDNYATCSRCVRVLEDIDPKVGATRQYFQSGGTFTLEEEGIAIGSGRGTFTLNDVTLVEVEIDENFNSTPVPNGACLYIAELTWDDPLVIPDEWTCDPDFFDAADVCDCACGAYDPDCDVPDQVFGCDDPALAFCDAAGECAAVPSWWDCDAAEFDDGATCNCECGGPDPDCDGENPVDGCDAGQSCGVAGLCLDPENICDDLTDNDEDSLFDCDDATACDDSADCVPGNTDIGLGCDANTDCTGDTGGPICLTEVDLGFPGGQCAEWCDLDNDACPVGTVCSALFDIPRGFCVPACETSDDCDNPEAECADGLCIAGAPAPPPVEWVCDPAFFGTDDGCDCGCGFVDPDCADETVASCEFCSADSCANDGTLFGCDLDVIVDDDNAVCQ